MLPFVDCIDPDHTTSTEFAADARVIDVVTALATADAEDVEVFVVVAKVFMFPVGCPGRGTPGPNSCTLVGALA